jgi:hypothetical protein
MKDTCFSSFPICSNRVFLSPLSSVTSAVNHCFVPRAGETWAIVFATMDAYCL